MLPTLVKQDQSMSLGGIGPGGMEISSFFSQTNNPISPKEATYNSGLDLTNLNIHDMPYLQTQNSVGQT
jgi:hypothetical protein